MHFKGGRYIVELKKLRWYHKFFKKKKDIDITLAVIELPIRIYSGDKICIDLILDISEGSYNYNKGDKHGIILTNR